MEKHTAIIRCHFTRWTPRPIIRMTIGSTLMMRTMMMFPLRMMKMIRTLECCWHHQWCDTLKTLIIRCQARNENIVCCNRPDQVVTWMICRPHHWHWSCNRFHRHRSNPRTLDKSRTDHFFGATNFRRKKRQGDPAGLHFVNWASIANILRLVRQYSSESVVPLIWHFLSSVVVRYNIQVEPFRFSWCVRVFSAKSKNIFVWQIRKTRCEKSQCSW